MKTVQRIQEVRKGEEAKIREYIEITIASQEKAKSQTARRHAETARQLTENEAMTNLPFSHKYLLPNHSLRSAISGKENLDSAIQIYK
jgi:hypothetical protein